MDTEERAAFTAASENWMVRGGGLDIEIVPPGTLATQEMILNIGPQHPSTHGVLRIILELDGEVITRAEPVIGYMHRGAEKLAEYRDTRQVLVLMNRHDWLSAFNNELGWMHRGRAARRDRGARTRELDPDDARGVEPHPEPPDVHGFVPARARRDHARSSTRSSNAS